MNKFIATLIIPILSLFFLLSISHADIYHNNRVITADETWTAFGNDHIVTGYVIVSHDATLTIEPGVTVKFNEDAKLSIGDGTGGGQLIARGTKDNEIVFTSNLTSPAPGDWQFIFFNENAADTSIIEHAVIEYSGGNSTYKSAIYLFGDTSPTFRNCLIRYSATRGISFQGPSTSEISGCCFTNNGTEGIWISTAGTKPVINNNSFTGNGSYPIHIYGATTHDPPEIPNTNIFSANNPDQIFFHTNFYQNYTMHNIGIPYYFDGDAHVDNHATLTIQPGVEIRFNQRAALYIDDGILDSRGTDTQKIIFTSNEAIPEPGDWDYILFNGDSASDSILEHVIIEYGGRTASTYQTLVHIIDSSPILRDCILRQSETDGIDFQSSSDAQIIRCDIINNNRAGVWVTDQQPLITGCGITANDIGIVSNGDSATFNHNNIQSNTSYGVYNSRTSLTANAEYNWWGDSTGPSGVGPGIGDAVSEHVDYIPWLGQPFPSVIGFAQSFGSVLPDTNYSYAYDLNNNSSIDGIDLFKLIGIL